MKLPLRDASNAAPTDAAVSMVASTSSGDTVQVLSPLIMTTLASAALSTRRSRASLASSGVIPPTSIPDRVMPPWILP